MKKTLLLVLLCLPGFVAPAATKPAPRTLKATATVPVVLTLAEKLRAAHLTPSDGPYIFLHPAPKLSTYFASIPFLVPLADKLAHDKSSQMLSIKATCARCAKGDGPMEVHRRFAISFPGIDAKPLSFSSPVTPRLWRAFTKWVETLSDGKTRLADFEKKAIQLITALHSKQVPFIQHEDNIKPFAIGAFYLSIIHYFLSLTRNPHFFEHDELILLFLLYTCPFYGYEKKELSPAGAAASAASAPAGALSEPATPPLDATEFGSPESGYSLDSPFALAPRAGLAATIRELYGHTRQVPRLPPLDLAKIS